jgi:zinc transporter ZupT
MYKMTNKRITGLVVGLLGLNGCSWLIVNLFSLSEAIREFSMGFTLALILVCVVLLFIPESKRLNTAE